MIKYYLKPVLYCPLFLLCFLFLPVANAQYHHDTANIMSLIKAGEHVDQASPDSAARLYRLALKQSEEVYFTDGITSSIHDLYESYTNRGLNDSLMNILQNALMVCNRSMQLTPALPILYNDIGNLYKLQSKYELAMNYYLKAITLIERIPSKKVSEVGAYAYNNLGVVLMAFERDSEALYYLNKAELDATKDNNYRALGFAWTNKGVIYSYHSNWEKSKYYLQLAIALARKYRLISAERFALVSMSGTYSAQGMPHEAINYSQQALSLKGDVNPYYQYLALKNIGESYFQLQDYKIAKHYLLDALDIAKKDNLVKSVADTHRMLAEIYSKEGLYKDAYEHIQASFALERNIQNEDITQNLNQLEIKYRTAQKDKEILSNRLQISQQENYLKKKNIWIGGISAALLLLITLFISWYRINKHKQHTQLKEIELLKQQQKIAQLVALMEGEEKERIRIAQELHDGIVVQFSAAKMGLRALPNHYSELSNSKAFHDVLKQFDDATRDLRTTAHNLMPDVLLEEGLTDAVYYFCKTLQDSTKLAISFQIFGQIPRFASDFELSLYRIIQELVHNIIKHAHADRALVQLNYQDGLLSITVEDNGIGILDKTIRDKKGIGLKNIYSRVATLNGHIDLRSTPKTGTTLYLEFEIDSAVLKKNAEICL